MESFYGGCQCLSGIVAENERKEEQREEKHVSVFYNFATGSFFSLSMLMLILVTLFLTLVLASEENCCRSDCKCGHETKPRDGGLEIMSVPCVCEFSRKCVGEEDNYEMTTAFTFEEATKNLPPSCYISDTIISIPYGYPNFTLNATGTVDPDNELSELRFLWKIGKSPYDPEEVPIGDACMNAREITINSSSLRSGTYWFILWVGDGVSITRCSKYVTIEDEKESDIETKPIITIEKDFLLNYTMDPDTLPIDGIYWRHYTEDEGKDDREKESENMHPVCSTGGYGISIPHGYPNFTLNATNSTDPDNATQEMSFRWRIISTPYEEPEKVPIPWSSSESNERETTIDSSNLKSGTYFFYLRVSDSQDCSLCSFVVVIRDEADADDKIHQLSEEESREFPPLPTLPSSTIYNFVMDPDIQPSPKLTYMWRSHVHEEVEDEEGNL